MISNRETYINGIAFPNARSKQSALISLLFVLLSPIFINAEVLSLVLIILCCYWVVISSLKLDKSLILLLWPLFIILIIGSYGIFVYTPYDVIRDFWYVGQTIPVLFLGYILAKYIRDIRSALLVIIIAALIAATVHLYNFVTLDIDINDSVQSIRNSAGRGYIVVVLGIVAISMGYFYSLGLSHIKKLFFLKILIFLFCSLFLSYSRTLWLSLFVLLFYIYINSRNIKLNSIVILIVTPMILSLTLYAVYNISSESDELSFTYKLMSSIKEVSISGYSDIKKINTNWRGYESYKALETYTNGTLPQLIFGHGFGKQIDLGFYMKLGENEYRYIPITHNGYLYILVKVGIIGLLLYFMFFVKVFRFSKKYSNTNVRSSLVALNFLRGLSLLMLILTIIVSGFFNPTLLPVIVLIGFFLGYLKYSYQEERRLVVGG